MLQITVSTFRRFWVGGCVCDSPKAARWLAAADGRFQEKLKGCCVFCSAK
jgi:hypothetical protein